MRLICGILALLALWPGASATARGYTPEMIAKMLVMELSPTRAMEGGEWFTNKDQQGRETGVAGQLP